MAVAGRKLIDQHGDVVVSLVVVNTTKLRIGNVNKTFETPVEGSGAIIDPTGLVVTTLSAVDGSVTINQTVETLLLDAYSESAGEGKDLPAYTLNTYITSAAIVLSDGTSLPAELESQHSDPDIAFFQPLNKPAKPLKWLDLQKAAVPKLLNQVFTLERLGSSVN